MSNFIVIGSSNDESAARQAVFREIVDGSVANAHYLGLDALFRGNRLLYRVLTNRKTQRFTRKKMILSRTLGLVLDLVNNFLYKREQSVNIHKLTPYLSETDENYLIFCPGTRIDRVTDATLRALRDKSPRAHLIFYLVDSIERTAFMNSAEVGDILNYIRNYDAAYTYDRSDAELYKEYVRFIEIPLWRSAAPIPPIPAHDLYFCGHAKRRHELLLAIYHRLQEAGLRCHYRVVCGAKEIQSLLGITLSDWTPYHVTAEELIDANCILEILAIHNRESTLRYKEAVMYNKKFLTTNPAITNLPYYDLRWMRVFHTAEDIDLEWLHAVEDVDYGYRGDFSAETFLKRVEELTSGK